MNPLYQLLDPARRAALAAQQQDVSPETDAALQSIGVHKDADPGIVTGGPVTDTGTPAPNAVAPTAQSPRDEVEQRLLEKLRTGTTQSGTPGSIVNTAPDWYKAGAPPARSIGSDVMNTIADAGAAGAQKQADLSAKEPLRPFAMKAADQSRANQASLLGGLASLLNRKQNAFQANQDAALKDAQMFRALNGTGGVGSGEQAYLNYDQRRQEFAERQRLAAEKEAEQKRRADPESDESHQAQAALVGAGIITEDQARGKSAAQLEKFRTAYMQGNMIDSRNELTDRKFAMDRAAHGADKETEQLLQIDKEKRQEQNRKDEAFIPGTYYVNGHPPSSDVVKEARGFVGDRELMMNGAQRLKEIQGQLSSLEGALGGYKYTQWLASPEAKKVLAEAKLLNTKMSAAARNLDHMGVPQQFEIDLQKSVNPDAGTLQGFFTGPVAWDAVSKFYGEEGAKQARLRYGLGFEGDGGQASSTAQDRPAEQQVRALPKPVVHAYKRGGVGEEIPVQSGIEGGQPAAGGADKLPMPGATGSTPIGVFTVKTAKGNSSPRPMTQAQYEKAAALYGADNVTRMQ